MIHLKNFTEYNPKSEHEKSIKTQFNALFYRAETGEDWYQTVPLFRPDTYKIKYDEKSVIQLIAMDASSICPAGGSIIEVESIPEYADADGQWIISESGEIKPREQTQDEIVNEAKEALRSFLDMADQAVTPLQDAVDLQMATDEEVAKLREWKIFRIQLNRIDVTKAPSIDWPPMPK